MNQSLFCLCLLFFCWFQFIDSYQITSLKQLRLIRTKVIPSIPTSLFHQISSNSDSERIISPFETNPTPYTNTDEDDELPLTKANVELVLNEIRPSLQNDGGDVHLIEIDGPVVKLEFQGACSTCASSAQTFSLGIERRLKERIPSIADVIEVLPEGPPLTEENIEEVLSGVRPFLSIAGGQVELVSFSKATSKSQINLKMLGTSVALHTVKIEITQRLLKHFKVPLIVNWESV